MEKEIRIKELSEKVQILQMENKILREKHLREQNQIYKDLETGFARDEKIVELYKSLELQANKAAFEIKRLKDKIAEMEKNA